MVVGLGNPGSRYEDTRHNIGHVVVDRLMTRMSGVVEQEAYRSRVFTTAHEGQRVFGLMPGTYMNRSGEPVAGVLRDLELDASDALVVYDDLDLPVGKLRFKRKGSSGGHRGIESLLQHIGSAFHRLRIGIGRPELDQRVEEFVLEPFGEAECELIAAAIDRAVEGCHCWLTDGIQKAMNEFNADEPPPSEEEPENDEGSDAT